MRKEIPRWLDKTQFRRPYTYQGFVVQMDPTTLVHIELRSLDLDKLDQAIKITPFTSYTKGILPNPSFFDTLSQHLGERVEIVGIKGDMAKSGFSSLMCKFTNENGEITIVTCSHE